MKFGKVDSLEGINLSLPPDNSETAGVFKKHANSNFSAFIGCGTFNKVALKNFYPKKTKDELKYYSSQFNSLEMNATYYQKIESEQYVKWKNKTPPDFKFFPKVTESISSTIQRNNFSESILQFTNSASFLGEKLGMIFMELNDNFTPNYLSTFEKFIIQFPNHIHLAIQLDNAEWHKNEVLKSKVFSLFEKHNITNIIIDSAGRRDMLHMRLTTPVAYIRFVGTHHPSDYTRLDEWVDRISTWKQLGLNELCFFLHQNIEKDSALLAKYFIEKLNTALNK